MPSVIIGNPPASGAQQVIGSGDPWTPSFTPVGGIQFLWAGSGGNCYIGFSGGGPPLSGGFMTVNSGQMYLSGGANSGLLDGMLISSLVPYFVPKLVFNRGVSGQFNVFAICDPTASGGRLYFEAF